MTYSEQKQSFRSFRKKLHSESGETITEVLVAALVVVLGSVLLATMVSASYRMIRNSQKNYDNYLSGQNALASLGSVSEVSVDSSGNGNKAVLTVNQKDTAAVGEDQVPITSYSIQLESENSPTKYFYSYRETQQNP